MLSKVKLAFVGLVSTGYGSKLRGTASEEDQELIAVLSKIATPILDKTSSKLQQIAPASMFPIDYSEFHADAEKPQDMSLMKIEKKHPILFVGGFTADALVGKIDEETKNCSKTNGRYDYTMWLEVSDFLYKYQCWVETMTLSYDENGKYVHNENVDVKTKSEIEPLGYHFNTFSELRDKLEQKQGYNLSKESDEFFYDWRKSPREFAEDGTLARMKSQIEALSEKNNSLPVVIVSHSYGGLVTMAFLTRYLGELLGMEGAKQWRSKYVKHWGAFAAALGGTGITPGIATTPANSDIGVEHYIEDLPYRKVGMQDTLKSFSGIYALIPTYLPHGTILAEADERTTLEKVGDRVLSKENKTTKYCYVEDGSIPLPEGCDKNVGDMFIDSNKNASLGHVYKKLYDDVSAKWAFPNLLKYDTFDVPTNCYFGQGHPVAEKHIYGNGILNTPTSVELEKGLGGDATLNRGSLMLCGNIGSMHSYKGDNTTHLGILKNDDALAHFQGILGEM